MRSGQVSWFLTRATSRLQLAVLAMSVNVIAFWELLNVLAIFWFSQFDLGFCFGWYWAMRISTISHHGASLVVDNYYHHHWSSHSWLYHHRVATPRKWAMLTLARRSTELTGLALGGLGTEQTKLVDDSCDHPLVTGLVDQGESRMVSDGEWLTNPWLPLVN